MGKKRQTPKESQKMEDSATRDRHKARKTVALSPLLYSRLAELAAENERPVYWEIRRILQEHLRGLGRWPPPGIPDGADA